MTIWCESPQGSDEWLADRCGVLTASKFIDCMEVSTRGATKGEYKAAAQKYAKKLAFERISNRLFDTDDFSPWQAKRGNALEPDARERHEREKGVIVEQVSLALTDDKKFGASLDGRIDDDGMSEYKCFMDPEKAYAIITKEPGFMDAVMPQIQGGLWITGREWCHFCLYCPQLAGTGLDFVCHTIERDDNYIEEMEAKLWKFDRYVEQLKNNLMGCMPF
jgi:hypothetical protein